MTDPQPTSARSPARIARSDSPARRRSALAVALLCLPLVAGSNCEVRVSNQQGTKRVETNQMTASMTVVSSQPGQFAASVTLCCGSSWSGRDGELELAEGEALVASIGNVPMTLSQDPDVSWPIYRAGFERVTSAGRADVSYWRYDGTVVRSGIELLDDFEVTHPRPGDVFDVTDDLVIEWTPGRAASGSAPAVMVIHPHLVCQRLDGRRSERVIRWQVEDDGQLVYALRDLREREDPELDRRVDCTLGLRFERSTERVISPPYGGNSRISSSVRRSVLDVRIRL